MLPAPSNEFLRNADGLEVSREGITAHMLIGCPPATPGPIQAGLAEQIRGNGETVPTIDMLFGISAFQDDHG